MDSDETRFPAEQRALARVREHQRTIEGLTRIGPENLPLDRLMQHFAAQVSRVTNIDRTKVLRYRPEKGDLLIAAGVGWGPAIVGKVGLGADYESPAGRAFRTASSIAISNISLTNEIRLPDLLREHGIVALLNVPIMINGLTWGVLEVDNTQPTEFDEWDTRFLTVVANTLGVCLALSDANQSHIEARGEAARQRATFDVVIRELQHRIKNNLQIIIAFLTQKARQLSPDIRQMLNDVIGRVQSVALAHDLLSVNTDASSVHFDDYLRTLCVNVPKRPEISDAMQLGRREVPRSLSRICLVRANEMICALWAVLVPRHLSRPACKGSPPRHRF